MGSRDIGLAEVLRALGSLGATARSTARSRCELRVPRTLLGILVGAALGVAGAILQGVTRNPLADAGIMGINAGAAAFVVFAITVLGVRGVGVYVWFAFAGAVARASCWSTRSRSLGREGATPVKLALAGAAVTAGLASVTTGIVMTNVDALNELRFWQVGSLAGRYAPILTGVAPFLLVGLRRLARLRPVRSTGSRSARTPARGLGQQVGRTRVAAFAVVAVLAGAATAACGPIVFVGLVVPHLARFICGPDYRWILPYSMLLAPIVLLLADVLGRVRGRRRRAAGRRRARRARRAVFVAHRALRAGCRRSDDHDRAPRSTRPTRRRPPTRCAATGAAGARRRGRRR